MCFKVRGYVYMLPNICFFHDLAKTLNGYSCDIAAIYPDLAVEEAAAKQVLPLFKTLIEREDAMEKASLEGALEEE